MAKISRSIGPRALRAWQKLYELLRVSKNAPLSLEFLGLVLLALTVILVVSLGSFDIHDNDPIMRASDVHNWLGPLGAKVAHGLYSLLGIFAYLLPVSTLYFALRLIFLRPDIFSGPRLTGLWLLTLSFAPLLAQSYKARPLLSGSCAQALANTLVAYCGVFGLGVISLTLMACGLLLILQKPYLARTYFKLQFFSKQSFKFLKSQKLIISKKAPIVVKPAILIKAPELITQEKPLPSPLIIKPVLSKPESKPEVDIQIIERDREASLSAVKSAEHEGLKKEFTFALPPLKLLDYDAPSVNPVDQAQLKLQAEKLQRAFLQFGIEGSIREIRPGPVVTNFEFVPAPGIKLSRISALADDIAMAMFAVQVRIVTPIPGKGAVGIEVPNARRETVYLKEIVADVAYRNEPHKLCMAIGKDVEGVPYFMNLADMPHVLIAGTTGSGKSVSVNAMICSILYRATPLDVRFLMIDPKMLELSVYTGIPHLLLPPIIDSKKAGNALRWAVKEMDQRYTLMKEAQVRDITSYNELIASARGHELKPVEGRAHEHLPFLVIVVDEYADLLAIAGKEVEGYIMRLAQKARACGIHVMLATQRPSVDVITGVIKANFPVRMGFRLASSHDSKTIVNKTGAEKLLGRGDVLIMPPGSSDLFRVHGAYVSEKELARVVQFWQEQKPPEYNQAIADFSEGVEEGKEESAESSGSDEKFDDALAIVREYNRCSTSFLQRQLSIGYNRAARIVEQMEKNGLVGPVLNARGEREIFLQQQNR